MNLDRDMLFNKRITKNDYLGRDGGDIYRILKDQGLGQTKWWR